MIWDDKHNDHDTKQVETINDTLVVLSCANNVTFDNISEVFSTNDRNHWNTTASNDPVPCAQWIYENPDSFVAEVRLRQKEGKKERKKEIVTKY